MHLEADLIAKRATLRWLAQRHPYWTHQELATALGMSRSWVSKWLHRLRQANPRDVMALHASFHVENGDVGKRIRGRQMRNIHPRTLVDGTLSPASGR
jgi:transcriptional regulator with XRE-family HTH domain